MEYRLYSKCKLLSDMNQKDSLNKILENKFIFSRKYDMERCDYEVENNPIDWGYVPFDDPEWAFVFNRMDYVLDLCIETFKTSDMIYINKAKELIFDYMAKNDKDNYNEQTRTLDTGIRMINWLKCIGWFEKYSILQEEEKEEIYNSLRWQVKYTDEKFQNFQNFSNWGLMQTIGILNVAKYINIGEDLEKKYEKMLDQHLTLEFFEDGMQWEQSAIYIMEVLVRLLQLENEKYMNQQYLDVLRRSAKAVMALTNVNNKTILIGDGDEVDTIGYLQRVAYILKDEEIIEYVIGEQLREEVYFDFGDLAVSFFKDIKSKKKSRYDFNLEDAGFYSIREGKNYLSFQNGIVGSGHGHLDNLHINYSYNNKKVLNDSGRFTYVDKNLYRKLLKSRGSHNVVEVDDFNIKYLNAWTNTGTTFFTPIYKRIKGDITYFESELLLTKSARTIRKILSFTDGTLFIADYCNEKYKANFIFDFEAEIEGGVKENEYKINKELLFKMYGYDEINKKEVEVAPIYNRLKTSVKIEGKVSQEESYNFFLPDKYEVEEFKEFEYLHYDRLEEWEKNYKLFMITKGSDKYIIGNKFKYSGNCDNVIKIGDKYIFASVFVYNLNTKEVIIFKY